MNTSPLPIYEILAAGFNGGTDATDDRILWVESPLDAIAPAIAGTGAYIGGELRYVGLRRVDYRLPEDAAKLRARLEAFAGDVEAAADCEDKHATVAAAVEAAINAGARVIQAAFGVKHGDTAGHYFDGGSLDSMRAEVHAMFAGYFDEEQAQRDAGPHDFTPPVNDRTPEKMPAHLAREGYRLEFEGPPETSRSRYWWTLCRSWPEAESPGDDWPTPAEAIADAEAHCARELARGADAFKS